MTYNVVQKIRGKCYLYSVEGEWDPDKKNSKQKRTYLYPCNEDGTPRDAKSRKPVAAGTIERLYWSKNIGQYHLLHHLATISGLEKDLADAFGAETAKDVLLLAIMRIAQPTSLRNIEDAVSSTYLRESMGTDSDYSSQRMSEIIHSIGRNEDARKRYCANAVKDSGVLVFDTTALFSSSRLLDMLEYGRKYRKSGLPQVNLGYVHSLGKGMPVHYKLYPGSISDSVTVINLVKELKAMGSTSQHLVMDRGFYSEKNFRAMFAESFGFTVPVPSGKNVFKGAISHAIRDMDNPENMFRFHGRTEMYSDSIVDMPFKDVSDADGVPVRTMRVLVFQNNDRRKDEIDTLAERIDAIERKAAQTECSRDNVSDLFDGYDADLRAFFDVSDNDGMIALFRKRNAISFAMRKCGRLVLLTTSDGRPEDVLETYHLRDWVEKDYEMLKDDMDGGLEYVRNSVSAEGMMYIQFIATGLRMYMNGIVTKDPMLNKLGIPSILRKLNLVTVSNVNGKLLLSEIGKKQRDILDAFGAGLPKL